MDTNGPTPAAANFLNKEGAIIPAWKTIIPTITPERKIGRTVNIVKSIRLPHLLISKNLPHGRLRNPDQ